MSLLNEYELTMRRNVLVINIVKQIVKLFELQVREASLNLISYRFRFPNTRIFCITFDIRRNIKHEFNHWPHKVLLTMYVYFA